MTTAVHPSTTHRVPVEHRFLGLDRRTLPPAAVALAVWLVWAVVLPFVDSRVAWTDTVAAGDVFQVADGVTFTPTTGWGVLDGLRTTDETRGGETSGSAVVLLGAGVVLVVQPGPWSGTATELLDQITVVPTQGTVPDELRLAGDPVTVTTDGGESGVGQGFLTPRSTGVAAAFVFDTGADEPQGVLIEVLGSPEQMNAQSEDITDMIESFRSEDAA